MKRQCYKKNNNTRNSSIELLRIVAMLFVVINHYNNVTNGGGLSYVTPGRIDYYYLYLSEAFSVCAVNVFVIISGYYLVDNYEIKYSKIIYLILQVQVFRILFYLVFLLLGYEELTLSRAISRFLPSDYYIILYIVLYLISPYINLVFKQNINFINKYIICIFILFSVCTEVVDIVNQYTIIQVNGLSTVGLYGSQQGYSIVNFILLYSIGGYLRVRNKTVNYRSAILGILVLVSMIFGISLYEVTKGSVSPVSWYYNSPFVICLGALFVWLFCSINITSRVINCIGKGVFTCYLLHGPLIKFFNVKEVVESGNVLAIMGHQMLIATFFILISVPVYSVYNCLYLHIKDFWVYKKNLSNLLYFLKK